MAVYQWGTPGAWADFIAAASFSPSVGNNGMVVGAAIANTTAPRMLAEVSFISTAAAIAMTAGAHLAVGLLPQLHDGAAYPTNDATGTALPGITYVRGVISMPTGTLVPRGSVLITIPYGTWKSFLLMRLGIGLTARTPAQTSHYRAVVEEVV